jgi:hypothetical protein
VPLPDVSDASAVQPRASGAPAIAELEDGVAFDLPPDVTARIESLASGFVAGLAAAPIGSPAFGRAIRAIDGLGEREVAATTQIAARFQDRPVRVLEDVLDERAPLSRHVRELEKMAAAMAARLAARGTPDGDADDLDDEDLRAAERVRELIPQLDADRELLEADNAAVAQQEQALWREIETLRQYAALAASLDQLMADHVDGLQGADPARARTLRVDVLFAIRRRRRDLLLQLAVATQGDAALRLIEQDNLEVIWALRTATTTTATALRAAALASLATSNRSAVGRSSSDGGAVAVVRQTLTDMLGALDAVEQRRRTTLEIVRRQPRD